MHFYCFFFLGLNSTLAGGIEDEAKDYEDVELTTREDISEFQELQEPLYEKLEEIVSKDCSDGQRIIKYSKGCVTWSGGYISEGEEPDYFVRY